MKPHKFFPNWGIEGKTILFFMKDTNQLLIGFSGLQRHIFNHNMTILGSTDVDLIGRRRRMYSSFLFDRHGLGNFDLQAGWRATEVSVWTSFDLEVMTSVYDIILELLCISSGQLITVVTATHNQEWLVTYISHSKIYITPKYNTTSSLVLLVRLYVFLVFLL